MEPIERIVEPENSPPDSAWRRGAAGFGEFFREWGVRLGLAGLLLVVLAYFAFVGALAYRASTLGESSLRWTDFALAPVQWSAFREKQGQLLSARGLADFKSGRFGEAMFNLSAGLARAPGEVAPRVALATLYATFNLERALQELEGALERKPGDVGLVEARLLLLRNFGVNEMVLAETDEAAQRAAPSARLRAVYVAQRVDTLLGMQRPAEARAALAAMPGEFRDSIQFKDLDLRTALAARDFAAAEAAWRALPADFPAAQRAALECDLALQRGDDEALARSLRRYAAVAENSVEPYLHGYRAWHRRGRWSLRDRVGDELLEFFRGNPEALKQFGALLVALRDAPMLQRTADALESAQLDPIVLQAQLTELALREGRCVEAFRVLERWESRMVRYSGAERSDAEFIRRLTRAANDESTAQATLLGGYLNGLPLQLALPRYQLALEVLPRAGMVETAAVIAEQARRKFAHSDVVQALARDLAQAKEQRQAADEQARAQERALALAQFADQAETMKQLAAQVAARDGAAARAQLKALRAARPSWALASDPELAFVEAAVAVLVDEGSVARAAVRRLLQNFPQEATALRVLRWAAELERDRPGQARLLREEIVQAGVRSDAVSELLAAANWEDERLGNLRTAEVACAQLDEALSRRDPDAALRLLALARNHQPAWLAAASDALTLREIRARLQLQQRPPATVLLRALVRKGEATRRDVRALLRGLVAEGSYEDALYLATRWREFAPEEDEALEVLDNLRRRFPI